MKRYLIVTGDDFGFSTERNAGVMEAFHRGAVKSASILLNCTGTDEAVSLFKSNSLCPGLHLNLTEGRPVSRGSYRTLTDSTGIFHGKIGTKALIQEGKIDQNEIRQEIEAQIQKYKEMFGTVPVYVDGHQHIHVEPNVVDIFADILSCHSIQITRYPVEINMASKPWVNPEYVPQFFSMIAKAEKAKPVFNSHNIRTSDSFAGLSTMGSDMSIERLQMIVLEAFTDAEKRLANEGKDEQPDFVTCELMTHPGYPTSRKSGGFSWGSDDFGCSDDRIHEINILTSQEMMDFYNKNNIQLFSHLCLLN